MDRQARLAPRYFSFPEAAVYVGTSVRTLRRLVAAGRLPAFRMAGTRVVRVDLADLDALYQRVPNARMFDGLDDSAQR